MIIIPNKYINKIKEKLYELDELWNEEFIDIIKNPQFNENTPKDSLPALVLADFKDENHGRNSENILDTDHNWIGLDYDNGMTIAEWQSKYKEYRYILYTTSSHTEEHNKFRVLLWVEGISGLDNETWRKMLKFNFVNIDTQACDRTRLFYLPKKGINYYYAVHDGQRYPLKMCPVEHKKHIDFTRLERVNKSARRFKNVYDTTDVQYYLSNSYNKKSGNGDSNTALYRAIVKCLANNDEGTLNCWVIPKAQREGWSSKEIDYKMACAHKFLQK